jgi:hypothetical protein
MGTPCIAFRRSFDETPWRVEITCAKAYAGSAIRKDYTHSGEKAMKTICVRVSKEFDHRLRVLAAQLDMNRSEFVRAALGEKVEHLQHTTEAPAISSVTLPACGQEDSGH